MKFLEANRIAPEGSPRFAASHLGPIPFAYIPLGLYELHCKPVTVTVLFKICFLVSESTGNTQE